MRRFLFEKKLTPTIASISVPFAIKKKQKKRKKRTSSCAERYSKLIEFHRWNRFSKFLFQWISSIFHWFATKSSFLFFFTVIIGSHVVVLSFTGFYLVFWVLMGFIQLELVLIQLYWVLPSFNRFLPSCTWFYLVYLGFTQFYLVFTWFDHVLPSFTWFLLVSTMQMISNENDLFLMDIDSLSARKLPKPIDRKGHLLF